MRVLMLVNWKVEKTNKEPEAKQSPDYCVKGKKYWFFKYFKSDINVDVIDVSSVPILEKFEKNIIHFYIIQGLKAIPKLKKYDLIISHGAQSAMIIALFRRMVKIKTKHILFDIGSFNSAAESGIILAVNQWASKSIDGVIYHTSKQIEYYKKFYPWIVDKSKYIQFGTDPFYFCPMPEEGNKEKYIICVGYNKRDWKTLIQAYRELNGNVLLKLIGHIDESYSEINGVIQIPYIDVKELKKQISNALFCVLPLKSFNYSFGQMTLLQQMSMEKCVIVADVPSVRDYVIDNVTGIFYKPENSKDLCDKMKLVLNNERMAFQIGKAARRELINMDNEEKMALEIEKYFYKVIYE